MAPQGGNPWGAEVEDPGYGNIPRCAPSLWRRMVQMFQGDPITGNQHFAPPAAAQALAVPDFAVSAVVSISGDSARWTFDGSGAGAANGIVSAVGVILTITGRASLKSASIFPNSAATVVDVVYFD
jgi:hypothetical protein